MKIRYVGIKGCLNGQDYVKSRRYRIYSRQRIVLHQYLMFSIMSESKFQSTMPEKALPSLSKMASDTISQVKDLQRYVPVIEIPPHVVLPIFNNKNEEENGQ